MADLGNYDPKKLEGRADDGVEKFRPREFFWDSLSLYVVSAIVGLAVIDALTEYIRGSAVTCVGENVPAGREDDAEYVNGLCATRLPNRAQFFPVFIVVHAIAVLIPHYLWLNHYGGNFEFFFAQASALDRLRDEKTGEYSDKNQLIMEQLTLAFTTYKQNWMYWLYLLKLATQLVLSLLGVAVAGAVFTDFPDTFFCPKNVTDTLDDEFWPYPGSRARCVYTSMRLFYLLRIADIILISLLILCLMWALIWLLGLHPTELGYKSVAKFCFRTGILPEHYIPKIPFFLRMLTSFPWPSRNAGPRISTNLDFMLMKLYRTDSGLGHVFRDLQILRHIKTLNDNDIRVALLLWADNQLGGGICGPEAAGKPDLKWKIEQNKERTEFKKEDTTLDIPDTFRGALVGLSALASKNELAIYITFGSPSLGIPSALSRVFDRVGVVNFNPNFHTPPPAPKAPPPIPNFHTPPTDPMADETSAPISIKQYECEIIEAVCPEDIFSSQFEVSTNVSNGLDPIWKVDPDLSTSYVATNFIVVGPISKDHEEYKTTVSLFLVKMDDHFADDCILLTIHPKQLSDKSVTSDFLSYTPPENNFEEEDHKVNYKTKLTEYKWPPKCSTVSDIPAQSSVSLDLDCGDIEGQFTITIYRHKSTIP